MIYILPQGRLIPVLYKWYDSSVTIRQDNHLLSFIYTINLKYNAIKRMSK